MAAIDEEKQETSFIERAIFIITPLLFVVVLVGLLIMLLDTDKRNKVIEFGHTIPVVKNLLPEPTYTASSSDTELRTDKYNEKIEELQTQLAELQQELSTANAKTIEQEQTIALMEQQKELEQETPDVAEVGVTDEQYTANVQELASMFAQMKPSKAAPIIQSMTLDEMALIFSQMRADDRVRIMEKMSPAIAADLTVKLKDNESSRNLEIAALQSRIEQLQGGTGTDSSAVEVNDGELAATFTSMEPTAAADLLLKMMDISSSKVLRILQATDSTARSSILESMAASNERTAAILVSRLMDN